MSDPLNNANVGFMSFEVRRSICVKNV
jgi:hypothetical protein